MQNIDQREVIKTTGAGFVQLRSPATVTEDIAQAIYRTQTEKRPIVVNMPADFMWQEVAHKAITLPVFNTPRMVPEGEHFDNALGMIASAKRPVILAGGGAIDAKDSIVALADRMEAPVATTLKAKGLFNDHPYNMDIFGTLSTEATYDLIAKSDCIICFGSSLHHFTTDKGKLVEDKYVVQINEEPTEISKNYHPTVALAADARLTADNIVYWLNEAEVPASGFTRDITPFSLNQHPNAKKTTSADGKVDYIYALEHLEQALPKQRIVTTDGGRFMTEVWCRVSVPTPKHFLNTAHFGSIGLGLQEAIGASYATNDLPVIMFTGDGGFMMGGINEFNTAVRLKRDLIVIVCNDAAYGAEHIQFVDRQMDPGLSTFSWPSFAEVATALGGQGIEVNSADDLNTAIEAIRFAKSQCLLNSI